MRTLVALVMALSIVGCATAPIYRAGDPSDDRALSNSIFRLIVLEGDSTYGIGTGVVVASKRGSYIMTAYHVVEGAHKVWAQIENDIGHRPHPLALVGSDKLFDIAFLVPDTSDNTFDHRPVPLEWTDPRALDEATYRTIDVKYVGYPSGILMRHVGQILCANIPGYVIQTQQPSLILSTVHFNGGASGSALLDSKNRILGLNIAILRSPLGDSRWAHSTSCSVPSSDIRMVLEQIESGRTTDHATLSIKYEDTRNMLPENFRACRIPSPLMNGVVVTAVTDSSTAEKADIRPGDIIVYAENEPIRTSAELFRVFQTKLVPGKLTVLRIFRGVTILTRYVLPQ